MEAEITDGDPASQRNAERLNRAIKILVIDGVLVMPNSRGWICHFVANDSDAIDSRSRLDRG